MAGPFQKTTTTAKTQKWQYWYTQAKPFKANLPYQMTDCRTIIGSWPPAGFYMGLNAQSSAIAYGWSMLADKLRGKISEQASMAVTIAERKQAINMIASRAVQLYRGARLLRKGDINGASKVFGLRGRKLSIKGARRKQFADVWLEASFGWIPLISDMYSAADFLQNPIKTLRPRAKTRMTWRAPSGGYPKTPLYGQQAWLHTVDLRFSAGCDIVGVNPDLWLANSLGLVNPATVAWELIPFSFVLDWVGTFGMFLENLSGLVGIKTANPWKTVTFYHEYDHLQRDSLGNRVQNYGTSFAMERSLSLPVVTPMIRPQWSFSVRRAITAVSLLTQQLSRA